MTPRPVPPLRSAEAVAGVAHLDLSGTLPVVVVEVTSWLDIATAPAVCGVVDAAVARRPPVLAVDLSACELADTHALGMLERVARRAALQGCRLVLVGVDRRQARVLRLTGLDAVLQVVDADADGDAERISA